MMGKLRQIEKEFESLHTVLGQEAYDAAYKAACCSCEQPINNAFQRGRIQACYNIAYEMFDDQTAETIREDGKEDARLRLIIEKQQEGD